MLSHAATTLQQLFQLDVNWFMAPKLQKFNGRISTRQSLQDLDDTACPKRLLMVLTLIPFYVLIPLANITTYASQTLSMRRLLLKIHFRTVTIEIHQTRPTTLQTTNNIKTQLTLKSNTHKYSSCSIHFGIYVYY